MFGQMAWWSVCFLASVTGLRENTETLSRVSNMENVPLYIYILSEDQESELQFRMVLNLQNTVFMFRIRVGKKEKKKQGQRVMMCRKLVLGM